jgi:hypothetical protein
MPKAHRGKTLKTLPTKGRGTCPLCGSTRIKLLYDVTAEDGSGTTKVCKRCKSKKV